MTARVILDDEELIRIPAWSFIGFIGQPQIDSPPPLMQKTADGRCEERT